LPVTVSINGLSVVHQTSNGMAMATVPDVCKTPSSGGPIPIPYPNIALSSDLVSGTTSVKIDGSPAAVLGSKFIKSTGDEAGVVGGVVSNVFAMEASFITFSPTVMLDGKPACRLTDKMLMNKGNTVCMAGELQGPVPAACPVAPASSSSSSSSSTSSSSAPFTTPAPPPAAPEVCVQPEEPKHCVLRGVNVKCSHDERKLWIDLAKRDTQILQVVSKDSSEADYLIVEWDGKCDHGHAYCPAVGVQEGHEWKLIDKKKAKVPLPAPWGNVVRDWCWIFKLLASQKNVDRNYHTIKSYVCLGREKADANAGQWLQVQVFPEVEWKASMEIGYSHQNTKDAAGKPDAFHYDAQSTWTIGGSVEAKFGAMEAKYALEAKTLADSLPLFGSLLAKVGWAAKVFDAMSVFGADVKLTPRWPKWTFGGGLTLVEIPGKPTVGSEGSFKFGFAPLFGIEMQVSILDWLIRFAGGLAGPPGAILAQMLVQVRKRFAKGVGSAKSTFQASLDIDIALTVGGDLKGGFGLKFLQGKCEIDPSASLIDGGVDVKIEGRVIGKARVWRFETSGGGKIGAASPDALTGSRFGARLVPKGGKDPMAMKGQIYFTGLAVYYLLYLEVGIAGAESDPDAEPEYDKFESHKGLKNKLFEEKGICVLMKPWTWPK
jgi:uncharacterized Zn-binding protein involved in type VI secretion